MNPIRNPRSVADVTAPPQFDYELGPRTAPERFLQILQTLPKFTVHWIGDSGAIIERTTSERGLVRIRIRTGDIKDIEQIRTLVAASVGDLTDYEIEAKPTYPVDGHIVAWILFHWKEDI